MLYDAKLSQDFAAEMQKEGIYVTGFYYPVVPQRTGPYPCAAFRRRDRAHLDRAIAAFIKVGNKLGVLK